MSFPLAGEATTEPALEATPPTAERPTSLWQRRPWFRYALRCFLLYLASLWGALTIAFFFFRMLPGDPVSTLLQSMQQQYGTTVQASGDLVARYRTEFGLDGSVIEQYLRFLKNLVLHQDFGPSLLAYPTPAQDVIGAALPWTIGLMGITAVLSWIIGVAAGAIAGWRRGKVGAEITANVAIAFSQMPFYFVALVLVYVFSYLLGALPNRSAYDSQLTPGWNLEFIGSVLQHGILPAVSIVVIGSLGWLLSTRMLIVPLLGEDFLSYAEAKGLKPSVILRKYALRNCYLPQVTAFGLGLGFIFNGNVLVEQLFSYPGLGSTLVAAIKLQDLNTIMGITSLAIFAVLTANFVLELILPLLDPRIKGWR